MKKLVAITIALSMILLSLSVVFADDEDSGSSYEAPESEIVLPDTLLPAVLDDDTIRESDLMLRQFSVNLAQALATPTGNETAADIYALLYSAFINNPGGTSSFSVTDSIAIAWLQNIAYYLGYNNNSSQASPLYYTLLSGNELSISELMYVLVSQMLNLMDLSATDSSNNPIPLVQLFVQLANDVTGLSTNNTSQLNTIVSIASKLTDSYGSSVANRVYDIWAYMRDTIHGYDFYYTISALNDIKTSSQTLVANTNAIINSLSSSGDIASSISSLNNDVNNISWIQQTMTSYGLYDSELNVIDTYATNLRSGTYYYKVRPTSNYQLYKFVLPIYTSTSAQTANSDIDITGFYYLTGSGSLTQYVNVKYYFNMSNDINYINLYLLDFPFYGQRDIYIKLNVNHAFRFDDYNICFAMNECSDYYIISDFIKNYIELDTLKKFELIYASDDLIEAKEAQQPLEDSVLENFTGSGSASASVSDANDINGIQSSIKGSLDTGDIKPSGIGTILDTSNPGSSTSFFGFWTQNVADDINGVNNIPQTRSVYVHLDDSGQFNDLVRSQTW